jgi:hypothetical protein
MSAYESLAICNFYLNRIKKSEYYIDRVYRRKTEAKFSVLRKSSLKITMRKYRNFKPQEKSFECSTFKLLKNVKQGIKDLFSQSIKNYSMQDE